MAEREMYSGWNIPTPATLKKYGLSVDEWKAIIDRQNGLCPICEKVPTTGRGVLDHEHVYKWKVMPSERRKLFVRGVTCWFCNHSYLGRGITESKALNVAKYLRDYATRRPA